MARVKPRSNVYAVMPILACLIMGYGIWRTYERIQIYTAETDPDPKDVPLPDVPERLMPEQPKAEEAPEAPVTEGEEEEAPGDEIAPTEGDDEGGAVAPAEGGEEEGEEEEDEEEPL